jgi:hypothetical protein
MSWASPISLANVYSKGEIDDLFANNPGAIGPTGPIGTDGVTGPGWINWSEWPNRSDWSFDRWSDRSGGSDGP